MVKQNINVLNSNNTISGFIGNYEAKITSNFRTIIPAEFRSLLNIRAVITKGFESAFFIIPEQSWKSLISPISKTSFLHKSRRDTSRYLIANSYIVNFDSQGRFVIPASLRNHFEKLHIQVPGQLIFAGMLDYIEVWDKSTWETQQTALADNADKIAEMITNEPF